MNNYFENFSGSVKEKVKEQKKRIIAGVIAVLMALGISHMSRGVGSDDGKIYFRSLINKTSVCTLYDEDGNPLEVVDDVSYVANFDDNLEKSEFAAVITGSGKIKLGYIDGTQVENQYIEVVDDVDLNEFSNVFIVTPRNGVFLRQNKILDHNTDDAKLLSHGTYLLGYGETETSFDNAYNWRKVLYVNGSDIQFGYVADEFLLNTDLSKFNGEVYEVVSKKMPLKLRNHPSFPEDGSLSNVIDEMPNGSLVCLIPNVNSKYYDEEKETDWRYVAYKGTDGEIKFGWCASSVVLADNRKVSYLSEFCLEDTNLNFDSELVDVNSNTKNIYMVVDTSSVNYVDLKLRQAPDLDSEIVALLDNGTNIIVNSGDWDNQIMEDSFEWVKVSTSSGKTGYVASKYLKEKTEDFGYGDYQSDTANIEVNGSLNGYVGIDCTPAAMKPGLLESILSGENSLCSSRGTSTEKPNFVVIKLGATGYGEHVDVQSIANPNLYIESFNLARLCEEHKIPYSFYYFCSALPQSEEDGKIISSELDAENDYIVNSIAEYVANNESTYFMRLVYLDIENHSDRLRNYNQPEKLTRMYNQQLSYLDDRFADFYNGDGIDVAIYTDHNALGYYNNASPIFYYSEIDDRFKEYTWVVNPSAVHSKSFEQNSDEIQPSVYQIRLDCEAHQCDVNIMEKSKFEALLERMGLSNAIQEGNEGVDQSGKKR